MCASLLLFMTFVFGKQRTHAVDRRSDTRADVGSPAADVSATWWKCTLPPLRWWRPTLHTNRKSNLAGRKREQMIFLYLSPWALLLNKISATTGCPPPHFSLFSFFNSIRKSADAIWSTTHVKPISAKHKKHFKTIRGPSHQRREDPRCDGARTCEPAGAFTLGG